MAKRASDVVVRAYDLGGFGDIAGAMRVASFLQRQGLATDLKASNDSALEKMHILKPDTPLCPSDLAEGSAQGAIKLDVAGHYRDGRVASNRDVPHNYTEDMDHPNDRGNIVPIYLKSGLQAVKTMGPPAVGFASYSPMFYRPFREWDLPKPGERDVKQQLMQIFGPSQKVSGFRASVEGILEKTDKIGFAHTSFGNDFRYQFSGHPYFESVKMAQDNSKQRLGVGVFISKDQEENVSLSAKKAGWNVVHSDGSVSMCWGRNPTLFCLGSQPQITTTSLFLSANMPNLVTGDLSLSDALYALIAMDGPAFFYETAHWKRYTNNELIRILGQRDKSLANLYAFGSNNGNIPFSNSEGGRMTEEKRTKTTQEAVVETFMDGAASQRYRDSMQAAVRDEIRSRFGDVQVVGEEKDGYYIQPGAQYLLQDATAKVVESLRHDVALFNETERTRKRLAGGGSVSVGVGAGVSKLELSFPKYDSSFLGHSFEDELAQGRDSPQAGHSVSSINSLIELAGKFTKGLDEYKKALEGQLGSILSGFGKHHISDMPVDHPKGKFYGLETGVDLSYDPKILDALNKKFEGFKLEKKPSKEISPLPSSKNLEI